MPLFMCTNCRCVENTALSNYWTRDLFTMPRPTTPSPALCSACDPEIGTWHGAFERKSAVGMVVGQDGILYGNWCVHKPK